jgi:hypothetical protein
MSPYVVCTPQAPVPFAGPSVASSFARTDIGEISDEDDLFVPTDTGSRMSATPPPSDAELVGRVQDFLERSATLIDVVAPPPWEDEDDIFDGEIFDDEGTEYRQLSSANPTANRKESIARTLMANEAMRYPGCPAGFLVALALTYRRILLDDSADPRDKVEILRRVYSSHEPEWMTAEIVYLHFVLLDQCRYLARPSANLERKEEILRWIYTDPELEDRPFSFKNCVKLATGNAPDFGTVHRRLKEAMQPIVSAWVRQSVARKCTADNRQPELFDT